MTSAHDAFTYYLPLRIHYTGTVPWVQYLTHDCESMYSRYHLLMRTEPTLHPAVLYYYHQRRVSNLGSSISSLEQISSHARFQHSALLRRLQASSPSSPHWESAKLAPRPSRNPPAGTRRRRSTAGIRISFFNFLKIHRRSGPFCHRLPSPAQPSPTI